MFASVYAIALMAGSASFASAKSASDFVPTFAQYQVGDCLAAPVAQMPLAGCGTEAIENTKKKAVKQANKAKKPAKQANRAKKAVKLGSLDAPAEAWDGIIRPEVARGAAAKKGKL
ncbi:hypothetical protein Q9295_14400 [Xinfangfangia sp. CPCC 101601]|uniref:Uncharacterized protein n=1 Tax=Pseudogemmobacter lacusdianii TaxID=3069608 RepID=A0ABU0W0Q0_9RHOB|nr:hypothetical protein [Xinfangfangia sp. CPCC 101601]MDQ2067566.1 hypothetical protein [Xinfangfangia sp. CPCC 101601]